jgi:nitrite reductase/ring-hydroxylating ferredoxin subunit
MAWVKLFDGMAEAEQRLLPGRPQLAVVDGKKICLVLREHQLLAVADKCTHNGESLSKGTVNYIGEVVCPWHGYRFQLTTGRESQERSADLETYPIKVEADGVYILV